MSSLLNSGWALVRGGLGLWVVVVAQASSGADGIEAARVTPQVQAAEAAPARLAVEAPLAGPLAHGAVVVPFHVDNLQIAPVYGNDAAKVVPRIGHLHLTLDNAPWHWVQASEDLIVIQGLEAGPHSLRVDLADARHQVLDSRTVGFTVPSR